MAEFQCVLHVVSEANSIKIGISVEIASAFFTMIWSLLKYCSKNAVYRSERQVTLAGDVIIMMNQDKHFQNNIIRLLTWLIIHEYEKAVFHYVILQNISYWNLSQHHLLGLMLFVEEHRKLYLYFLFISFKKKSNFKFYLNLFCSAE